jgi:DNA replication and repair protein RecF
MNLFFLKVQNFRNLSALTIEPTPNINFIYGANGSGKTSILEAIYFLGTGKSFRSHLANRIILHEEQSFSLFGQVQNINNEQTGIGIEKYCNSKTRLKVGNDIVLSTASLARLLPTQLINPDSYRLLETAPHQRRKFMDWGLFHVEPNFFPLWQRFQRALKQRNSALKQGVPKAQVRAWDTEFIVSAHELGQLREAYIQQLLPTATRILSQLFEINNLLISYYQGWEKGCDLSDVLDMAYAQDSILGYTQFGPHRADIKIKVNGDPVQDVLSRGEQKTLICVLLFAQGVLLQQLRGQHCIYLIDDLAAELDREHQIAIMDFLATLKAQIFITFVDKKGIDNLVGHATSKLFYLEKGEIKNK